MATPVIMPKQGQSVETCIITRWYKNKGDKISTGDLLFSYETDKAAFDLESPADGILLDTFFSEGSEVPVLVNVAVIGQAGEEISSFKPGTGESGEVTAPPREKTEVSSSPSDHTHVAPVTSAGGRIRISPRAKIIAGKKGLDYNIIPGSGPNGRIVSADIEKAHSGAARVSKTVHPEGAGGAEYSEQPLSNIRKLIARAMHSSLQNSAQLTHHLSADVRLLLEARRRVKEEFATGTGKQDITLNDMICWCVTRALTKHPEANTHFLGESLKIFRAVHLAIAVDTPRGLLVPTVKNADQMTLRELSEALKGVADSCRKGNIDPELIKSTAASFTISNLGNYGVEMFTPVINLPQVCILGVCTIVNRPADLGNSTFGFVPYIGLSLTYDHRAIDGGPATLFLKEIKDQIENFKY
jgi:pyruvate dehydrogenase E2 component (dihydrolipoamide acetyltransferase)